MAGSPFRHGPHWPADCPAIQAAMAATSRKPQVAGPITEMAPQPRVAPTRPREAESRVTLAATWPGIHTPE